MLTTEIQAEVLSLYFSKKLSIKYIANYLNIDRKTVRKIINRREVFLTPKKSIKSSCLDDFKKEIADKLEVNPDIRVNGILQFIRTLGYNGSYSTLSRWMFKQKKEKKPSKEADLKLDFIPGEVAQVDWGEFPNALGEGIHLHAFVMVLCYSRKIYIEFTRSEKFEDFLRCHENAFKYFDNKIPDSCWYDNLTSAVTERKGKIVRFNERFFAYTGHHGFKPFACNPARGNEKGRVENGVKFIRSNFWDSHSFKDFNDVSKQANNWLNCIANCREHRVTKKIPNLVFEHEEKKFLRDSNPIHYDTDEVISKKLRDDFHITYATNQYSAPWTLVGSVLTIRINDKKIKIYYQNKFITEHDRCYLKNQPPFTKFEHKEGLLDIKPQGKNKSLDWQIKILHSYGDHLTKYLDYLQYNTRSLKKECNRLIALATIYGKNAINAAVNHCLQHGVIGCDQVELYLKALSNEIKNPEPLTFNRSDLEIMQPEIDLRVYDGLLFKSKKYFEGVENE